LERRRLLRGGLSLGALSLLTGCGDLSGNDSLIDRALWAMLRFNDRVQAALFNPTGWRRHFPRGHHAAVQIQRLLPIEPGPRRAGFMAAGGRRLVDDDTPWTCSATLACRRKGQITRHICVEGWSQIGQWSGVPLRHFLKAVGADCARSSSASIVSTITAAASTWPPHCTRKPSWRWISRNRRLTPPWGAPLRLRIPTKLGFKNPKYIAAITVTNDNPGGYWEDQGYNWFSGS
jgi:hypothetical protein